MTGFEPASAAAFATSEYADTQDMRIVARLVGTRRTVQLTTEGSVVTEVADVDTASDVWVCPGLIDVQTNGYDGHDVRAPDASEDTIQRLVTSLWAQGITAICPTVTTGPEDRIANSLQAIAAARKSDPLMSRAVPCAHVEGPYLSPEDGPRGAHDPRFLRTPDLAEFARWQAASDGAVGIVTLAPELPGAAQYIRGVVASGVVAAIGHTAANTRQIGDAVAAGARLSTHLGNGAHAQIARHPNYIWDQLADDRLMASFIADGHHLPAATLVAMLRAKGRSRSVLVSDSVALAGKAPGQYEGPTGLPVDLTSDGRLSLSGTSLLAGAVRNLRECLAWAVYGAGVPLAAAVAMASTNPARLLPSRGLVRRAVTAGAPADLTMLRLDPDRGDIAAVATVVGGVVVHQTSDAPIGRKS
jgi:N-acetylglucosamine-6-phosphate deacetylase